MVPGNDHEGVWSSSLLETVFTAEPKASELALHAELARVNLRGDCDLIRFAIGALGHVNQSAQTSQVSRADHAVPVTRIHGWTTSLATTISRTR